MSEPEDVDLFVDGVGGAGETAPSASPSIPGYRLESLLGKGGMGRVFKARQLALDRAVAVKVLDPGIAQDDEYVARFVKEARLAGRLRHQNLVSALDCGIAGGIHYIIMEFVEGRSLDAILQERGALDERVALEIVRQVCEGLEYAWRNRVVHRDIKPRNILVCPDGTAKICDLGLARAVRRDPSLTSTGEVLCTPAYASPEQARGERQLDCRSDLYSLGVTFYELVTGAQPFVCASAADYFVRHATAPRVPPSERNPAVSRPVSALILEMMDPDPARRPATPGEVASRIRGLLSAPGEPHVPKPAPPRQEVSPLAEFAPPGPLGLSLRMDGGTAVVELRGKLLESMDADLKRQLDRLLESGILRVVVDLRRLDFLASRGVSVLIALMDAFRSGNGDLRLAAAPAQPKLVLDRLGVTLLLRHFPTVDEALRSFEGPPPPPIPSAPAPAPVKVQQTREPAALPARAPAPPATLAPRPTLVAALVALVVVLAALSVVLFMLLLARS